jgi:hypothetical protein
MSEKEIEGIPQIAQTLSDHLPKAMDNELKRLIAAAEKGQDTTIEIIDLFSEYETTRSWMEEQIASLNRVDGAPTGYSGLAGNPSVPLSQRWVCPEKPLEHWMMVIQEGEKPPTCKVDGKKMVCGSQTKR